jgi:A/G-specific adenine glycosylase
MIILKRMNDVHYVSDMEFNQWKSTTYYVRRVAMTSNIAKNIHAPLLAWYDHNKRNLPWRETTDPYAVWVSEVMLQQTQVKTVIPYYQRFLNTFPTIRDLAASDLQKVLKMWEGLGYYGRARNMHRTASIITQEHHGIFPDTWQHIHRLPGVGDYIAAAVLSIAFGHPYAVVDGNVKRVLARLFKLDTPVNQATQAKTFNKHAGKLLYESDPGKYNQAIMELGALVCTPYSPLCGTCPIQPVCKAFQSSTVDIYPRRVKKKQIPLYNIAIGVVLKKDRVLITQRRHDGLLGGLWEFPGGKIKKGETSAKACIREIKEETGLTVTVRQYLTQVKHAYTHFRIIVDVFICDNVSGMVALNGPVDYQWITMEQIDAFPIPRANHKFIPRLKEAMNKL